MLDFLLNPMTIIDAVQSGSMQAAGAALIYLMAVPFLMAVKTMFRRDY